MLQSPDFEAALEPPEEASADELQAMLEAPNEPEKQDEQEMESPPTGIPVPKMVSFLDVASQFFGQETVTFIDARDQGTYEAGHIPGALHIDAERLGSDPLVGADVLASVAQSQVLIVYCSGGQCDLSRKLATNLIVRGYPKVLVFEGGWNEWVEEGQPEEEGPMAQGGTP